MALRGCGVHCTDRADPYTGTVCGLSDRLSGKVALVTGVANDIGAGRAAMFAAQGAIVISVDLAECDVTDEADVERLMAGLEAEYGRIDVLVTRAAWPLIRALKRQCLPRT